MRVPLYDGAGLFHTVSIIGMEISLNSTWPGFGFVPRMLLLHDQRSVSDFQIPWGATEADSIYRLSAAGQRLGGECRGVSHGAPVADTVPDGVACSVGNGVGIGLSPALKSPSISVSRYVSLG